jgi:hypothetical protein
MNSGQQSGTGHGAYGLQVTQSTQDSSLRSVRVVCFRLAPSASPVAARSTRSLKLVRSKGKAESADEDVNAKLVLNGRLPENAVHDRTSNKVTHPPHCHTSQMPVLTRRIAVLIRGIAAMNRGAAPGVSRV